MTHTQKKNHKDLECIEREKGMEESKLSSTFQERKRKGGREILDGRKGGRRERGREEGRETSPFPRIST